jgi:hypothetical protein
MSAYFEVIIQLPNFESYPEFVGFEALTAVFMKRSVFWDIMPCPVKVNRHFRRTHHLHLQG